MNEKMKLKLIETKSLILGGCLVILMACISQMAQTMLSLSQVIPCFLMLGQPKMPESLLQEIKAKQSK